MIEMREWRTQQMSYNFRFVSNKSRDFIYLHSKWTTQIDALLGMGCSIEFFLKTDYQCSKFKTILNNLFTYRKNSATGQVWEWDGWCLYPYPYPYPYLFSVYLPHTHYFPTFLYGLEWIFQVRVQLPFLTTIWLFNLSIWGETSKGRICLLFFSHKRMN